MTNQLATITTTFRKLAWRAKDSDFSILQCDDSTCKGDVPDPSELVPGLPYTFYGRELDEHEKYGRQFQFRQFIRAQPHTQQGIVAYLIKCARLTQHQAGKLYDEFGQDAVKILRNDPTGCAALFPRASVERFVIASQLLKQAAATEDARIRLVELLVGRGFPGKTVDECIKRWGIHAAELVRRDPFRMLVAEIPGAGFLRCDRIYMDLGLPPGRIRRQFFALWYALASGMDGNTWYPIDAAREAIKSNINGLAVDVIDWRRAVKLGVKAGWLIIRKDDAGAFWLAETEKAKQEWTVAAVAKRLSEQPPCWPVVESIEGIDDHQRQTVARAFQGRIAILAGTPGTGKSHTAAAAIAAVVQRGEPVAVCAPTGKAAVRLSSALAAREIKAFATTVHRLLGVNRNGHDGKGWGFIYNAVNRMPWKYYVLDESSMLDTGTAASFFEALPDDAHLLLVGDPYQLPPVQHGAPFRDLIAAGIPYGELTEIKRNSGDLTIACRAIKDGLPWRASEKIDIAAGKNLKCVDARSAAQILESVKRLVASAGQQTIDGKQINPIWDVQVITGLNEKSDVSRKPLNEVLQNVLNPKGERVDGHKFRRGDKVTCVKNTMLPLVTPDGEKIYDEDAQFGVGDEDKQAKDLVANGEIGEVLSVEPKSMVVRFELPNRCVRVAIGKQAKGDDSGGSGGGSGCDFDLAYAISFHKSQGSQWPVVILVVDPAAYRIASRELWYTGLSRAEKLVLMVGPIGEAWKQCKRVELDRRKTFLKELVSAESV